LYIKKSSYILSRKNKNKKEQKQPPLGWWVGIDFFFSVFGKAKT
jgi:hypothetical protein